ncbi:sister chromatid cohesion 1 protein 1-like [Rosa chinensis]|uniref:sister chromatid cohesion 1 protein 1-like n=1 Tax=Rosa chinensis TaxID=74649 RepID=UPI001AD8A6A0|nr:sister chromatid cohesion 1 protein 1-like [Rosa chinensis]
MPEIVFRLATQLDSVDVGEPLNDNAAEGDQHQNLHQANVPHPSLSHSADPEDITLPKCYDPSDAHADLFNPRFERFEIEGDNVDLTSGEPTHIRPPSPNYLIPSPPRQDQHQEGQQANNVFAEVVQMQDVQENAQQRQRPIRRRKRKTLPLRSVLSSSSGKGVDKNSSEVNSGWKRRYSSKDSNDGLEPVSEDNGYDHPDPNFKVSRLSGNGPTPEQELLMETGPTQTQQPIINQPLEKVTDAIRMELKSHFEIPGGPQVESLNDLTAGMNRRGAALLFYQTCVLATRDFVKVKQNAPYEDILMTRGPKITRAGMS